MARSLSLIVALAAAAVTAAETSSAIELFLPQYDPQPLVASIVGGDSKAATYVFSCAPGTDSSDCGMTASATITQGPKTVASTYSVSDTENGLYAETIHCQLDSAADRAICTIEATNDGPETKYHSSTVATDSYKEVLQTVTVTAGFDKLSGGSGGSQTAEPTKSGDKSDGADSSQPTSSNVAPAVTQQALFAGVAALVGAMAL